MRLKVTSWRKYKKKNEEKLEFNTKDVLVIIIASVLSSIISVVLSNLVKNQSYWHILNNNEFDLIFTLISYSAIYLIVILPIVLVSFKVVFFLGYVIHVFSNDIIERMITKPITNYIKRLFKK